MLVLKVAHRDTLHYQLRRIFNGEVEADNMRLA